MNNKKTITFIFIGMFLLAIAGLAVLWLMLSKSSSDSKPSNSTNTFPSIEEISSSGSSSSSMLVREEAHKLVENQLGDLLDRGLMDIKEAVVIRSILDESDESYAKGEYSKASAGYETIVQQFASRVESSKAQMEAEELGQTLIDSISANQNVKDLAPAPYKAAVKLADEGSIALKQGNYSVSLERYKAGLEQIDKALEAYEARIDNEIDNAKTAMRILELKQAKEALNNIENWYAEHPELPKLENQLAQLNTLLPELQKARQLMNDSKFREAKTLLSDLKNDYPDVDAVEELYQEARTAFLNNEVKPIITESESLFKEGKLDESLEWMLKAQQLAPEEDSIKQAIVAIQDAIKTRDIELLLKKAYVFYEGFQWNEAREAYTKVLDLDPENKEAQKGFTESGKFLSLEIRYENKMRVAKENAQAGRFPKALTAFNQAMNIKPEYKTLSSNEQALKDKLLRQSDKVRVEIISDGKTFVSIIGAMPPEKFKRKTIDLYPDIYTFRGKRSKYRDVSFDRAINADNQPIEIVIKANQR